MNYTSIEQSKKLLELGLSPESADMYYEDDISIVVGHPWHEQHIPCWSVGALLELMPIEIKKNEVTYYLIMDRGGNGSYSFVYKNPLKEPWEEGRNLEWFNNETPLEAAYNMVVWLLENNYIKKEGNT